MPSMPVPFVGPSYQLANRRADTQRTVNMYPVRVESGSGKSQFYLKSVPGLVQVYSNTTTDYTQLRGLLANQVSTLEYIYAVVGEGVYRFLVGAPPLGILGTTSLGTLNTANAQTVVMASGREHLVITDGTNGYYYEYASGTFAQITDVDFITSPTWCAYLAGRFVFGNGENDQFSWSSIDDPSAYDALDFATAESSPDRIVRGVVYREELWLFGNRTTEIWRASSSADSAFERNTGVSISVGCVAPLCVAVADNSLFWIGGDENGSAVVYMASGYQPTRISTHAIEEKLTSSASNFATSTAYTYQLNGSVHYCINVVGLDTTICYNVNTGSWYEMAELYNGDFAQHRITHHAVTRLGYRFFGGSLVGHPTLSNRSVIYYPDEETYTFEGDTLCRERISPHYATPQYNTIFYPRFRLDCSVGGVVASPKYVQLSYSNDGGATWSASALQRSLGETGDRRVMVQWNRLGSARDRVWRVRCTEDCAFDIVGADIQAIPGVS